MTIDFMSAVPVENRPPVEEATMATPAPVAANAAPINPFDMAPVKARLGQYAAQIDRMNKEAAQVAVDSPETNTLAVEMAGQVKKLNKSIEDVRKALVEAPNQFVKGVNGLAKGFQSTLDGIENTLKRKITIYTNKVEMERREMERKAREEARKLQAELDAQAKGKGIEAPKVDVPVVPKAAQVTRTAEGTASIRKEWKHEVTDATAVPREYLIVDESAIRRAVKSGVREITGVRIFEDSTTVIRA